MAKSTVGVSDTVPTMSPVCPWDMNGNKTELYL